MKVYICKSCGAVWYSAASIENMVRPECETCGGEIEETEDNKNELETA